MTKIANRSQFEEWNGQSGQRWVASADRRDRVLAPVAEVLFSEASPIPGSTVLDIGSGCGATSLMAGGLVGESGSVLGIDLSEPMLEVARRRAVAAGVINTHFMSGDAQTHSFEPESCDLVVSRFGTMFFADPEAAFINIGQALRPGGRICMATWQPLVANEWLMVPGAALLRHTETLPTGPDGPGMFAQSEPDIVRAPLDASGFVDVRIEQQTVHFAIGQTLDEAVEYLSDSGPGRFLLETIPAGQDRADALADVRDVLVDYMGPSGVQLGGGVLLISARRPDGLNRS
jgi:SAM-dependent methyltransferase